MCLKRKLSLNTEEANTIAKRPNLLQYPDENMDTVMSEPFHEEVQSALGVHEESKQQRQMSQESTTTHCSTPLTARSGYSSIENSPTSSRTSNMLLEAL
ncbi:hypothetical protein BDY19DRAFT_712698 [Irpex rosettiformis]|uniref:Uncharacterized protein n=1 Tax=Irpex rosettiformis TaxID=378272 RepID=A0ACB8U7Y2_9APHY|nr:hypothetical protein BDY19DRAFT_712698 [Irpex rosettiformis]